MTEVIDVHYTAIIKDGGLFIPNVFSDINDGSSHIVQIEVDIEAVREQFDSNVALNQESAKKEVAKAGKKPAKRVTKKTAAKLPQDEGLSPQRKSAIDELEALDDGELSEMLKAYVNEGQISLENL